MFPFLSHPLRWQHGSPGRVVCSVALLLGWLFAGERAHAQNPVTVGGPILLFQPPCVFSQPWIPDWPAYESRVRSCVNPLPVNRVAMDDFECPTSGDAVGLRWWGVLTVKAQKKMRPYYVAIYDDDNCKPGQLLYETCVVPKVKKLIMDCTDRRVFVFAAKIPAFPVAADERYWLQISEDDAGSARPGVDDFLWSGRRPQQLCAATQMDAGGVFYCPLMDPCFGKRNDLSFEIFVQ